MATTKEQKIKTIILRTINDHDPAPWTLIRNEIADEMDIKNWMTVRNILQGLIDSRFVKRTESIYIEAYTR